MQVKRFELNLVIWENFTLNGQSVRIIFTACNTCLHTGSGSLHCVLRQERSDTALANLVGIEKLVEKPNLTKAWGVFCRGLASHSRRVWEGGIKHL